MNKKQYTSLLDDTSEIVILADSLGRILFFNKAAHLFFEYDTAAIADLSIYHLFSSQTHALFADFFSQSHCGDRPSTFTEQVLAISQDNIEQPVSLLISRVDLPKSDLFMLIIEDPASPHLPAPRSVAHGHSAGSTLPPAGELFLLAGPDLRISYMSANCRAHLGYSSTELFQKFSCTDLLYAEDQEKLQILADNQMINGIISLVTPLRTLHRAGGHLRIQTRIDGCFDSQGQLAYVVMRFSTAANQLSEQKPKINRMQYVKLMGRHTQNAVCFYNSDLTLRYVSPSVEHMLGYQEDALLTQEITTLMHPEDASRVHEGLLQARSKIVKDIHCRIRDHVGQYIKVQLSFKVIEQAEDQPLPLLTLLHGVRQFPISCPACSDQNNLLAPSLFDYLPNALLLLQVDTWQVIDANQRAVQLLGLSDKSQLLQRPLPSFWKEKNTEPLIDRLMGLSATEGQDIEYYCGTSGTFWGDTSLVHLPGAQSSSLLLHITDVSQRKQQEQKLILAKEAAEQTMKLQEDFLSVMSHEIRTPLNAVLGLANLMLDNQPREDQKKLLETLKFSSDNLSALMDDILGHAKLKAGEVILESKPFSLKSFIHGTKLVYQNLTQPGVAFRLLLEDGLPDTVLGDVNRLGQILNNLLNNAVKFTRQGHIALSVYQTAISKESRTLIFEIKDTGVGIPTNRLPVIFDPYQQASHDTAQQYGGTGLGLSIVKNLVELQQGTISLHSVEGKGTTFRIELPFSLPDEEPESVSSAPLLSTYQSLRGLRVLYVDDVIPNQLLMEGLASKWDIVLDTALDGREAVEKARKHEYDVILMDIQMPNMNGYEATQAIRSLPAPRYHTLPIIALSASVSDDLRHRIHQSGMNEYLPKPLDTYQLHTKLLAIAGQQSPTSVAEVTGSEKSFPVDQPDFSRLRELYHDDEDGYTHMLEQIKQLTWESQTIILEAIQSGKVEPLRFASHKIMSYVRMLKLRQFEELLVLAKRSAVHKVSPELVKQIRFHFDNFMATITQEIEVHTL